METLTDFNPKSPKDWGLMALGLVAIAAAYVGVCFIVAKAGNLIEYFYNL